MKRRIREIQFSIEAMPEIYSVYATAYPWGEMSCRCHDHWFEVYVVLHETRKRLDVCGELLPAGIEETVLWIPRQRINDIAVIWEDV